jgi:hypothetical protein
MGLGRKGKGKAPRAEQIAAAWRKRWLLARTGRVETLEALRHLGKDSVLSSLHADADGQFILQIETP